MMTTIHEKILLNSEKIIVKKYFSFFSLLFSFAVYAQTSGLSTGENYIYTKNCLNEDCTKKAEAVQYSDGLGRVKQVIAIKGSPSGKDIVTPTEYDAFGRQVKSYLPIPQSGTQNGAVYTNPKSNASQTYGTDLYFYSYTQLENSPSPKVLSTTKPGADFQGHSASYGYHVNSGTEVKKYTLTTTWLNGATMDNIANAGNYAAGQLMKTSVTDEDGNITTEFTNAKGQTLLVRKAVSSTQNADTYYLYNKYGQLAYVIPPLALSQPLTQTTLDNLCYQYKYDSRGRQVEKKLPGKGWEYMVYDIADKMIMSQDANMRANGKWFITKHDKFGRVLYTGIILAGSRENLQGTANNFIVTESKHATGFTKNGIQVYYTNTLFNQIETLLTVNYYDTYPTGSPARPALILGKNTIGDNMAQSINTKNLPTASYVKNIEDDNWTKSYIWYDDKARAVGTYSINHLGGYTKTETLLDFAGVPQLSKVYHKRLSADTEKIITQTFEYDSQNRLLVHKHKVDNNPEEILSQNKYNELSQLENKKVGGTSLASPLQSIDYAYNILGQMTKINDPANLGAKLFGYEMRYTNPVYSNIAAGRFNGNVTEADWKVSSEGVLKRYSYGYDNLNQLKDAIYTEPLTTNPYNNNYNENLTYDLNGNIKTLKRNAFPIFGTTSTLVDDLTYQYTGNRLDRILESSLNDTGYEGGNNLIDYDASGNMINMKDKGIQSIAYNSLNLPDSYSITQTDLFGTTNFSLTYLYRADGTKLRKTYFSQGGKGSANITRTTDYLDGFQYSYNEGSGVCTTCRTEVAYERQAFAKGGLLGTTLPEWILDFVPTAEGFFSFTENRYIYQYRDHLGNARVSYARNSAGALEITDVNNYYAFGMNHIGGLQKGGLGGYQNYKYNGKELQETGMYDYGARFYMPDIGRWGVIDPLAETTRRVNPYNYALNNPIMFIDPDGRKAMAPNTWEWNQPMNGALGYMLGGGSATFGSFEQFLGQGNPFGGLGNPNSNSSGGGGGLTASTTGGISSLKQYFNTNGINSNSIDYLFDKNKNGVVIWWTNSDAQYGDFNALKFSGGSNLHDTSQGFRKWSGYAYSANKFIFQPAADRAVLYGAGRGYSTTNLVFEKALPKILGSSKIYLPIMEISAVSAQRFAAGTKIAGRVLGGVGIGLGIYDMTENGVTTSNSLDLVMSILAVSPTGWGQAIAGGYFLANGITMVVTGKDIGQHIDGAVNKYYNDGVRAEEQRKFNAAMGY